MEQNMHEIIDYYLNYCGNNKMMIVYIVSLGYLMFTGKENRIKIVYPSFIIMGVVFNPLLYSLILKDIMGGTYWRIMWLIPVLPVIGFAVTHLIQHFRRYSVRIGISCIFMLFIMVLFQNIYVGKRQFEDSENWYKLPQKAIDTVDALLKVSDDLKCVIPSSLYSYVRQYKTDVKLLYGRDADGYIDPKREYWNAFIWSVYKDIEQGEHNYQKSIRCARYLDCNMIVTDKQESNYLEELIGSGYENVGSVAGMNMYYNPKIDSYKDHWLIKQYGYNDESTRMAYSLEGDDGTLVLIDGGYRGDVWMFNSIIEKHEYHVDAWILTQPTPDHMGAFLSFVENDNIKIDKVYIADIDWERYKRLDLSETQRVQIEECQDALRRQNSIQVMKSGEHYNISGLNLDVIYTGEDADYANYEELSDDWYTVFALNGNSETILFTCDADEKASDGLVKYIDTHKIDYLEVAYHNGRHLPYYVYDYMNPKVIFFDCCEEFFLTDSKNLQDRFKEDGEVYNFGTVPNWILFD